MSNAWPRCVLIQLWADLLARKFSKENTTQIQGEDGSSRFLRQELFHLRDNFTVTTKYYVSIRGNIFTIY